MKTKKLFMVGLRDVLKGLFLAIITAIVTFMSTEIGVSPTFDLLFFKKILYVSVIAFLSYIVKQFFTNSKGEILTKEAPKELVI